MEFLSVEQNKIVNREGAPIRLRGTCVGGWMNMENFINGYPGVESGIRAAVADVLGPAKAEFFFDRLLDHFLAEEDIAFIAQTGANVVRIALNYRHFEDDTRPGEWKESGFARLDRIVQCCAAHNMYAILDLHAVQGWQNPDWHSDNSNGPALFWQHRHFQDRWVALWEELARRYGGNPTIAGYDVVNEPQTATPHGKPRAGALNALYRRVVAAIRAVDPAHIIFLEGDGFAGRLGLLDAPFADNLVYSGHSYSPAAFGPGPYPGFLNGKEWDRAYMKQSNLRHEAFPYAARHHVPLWMGEFGALCNGPAHEHAGRLQALDDQIGVFEEFGAHWTTWTYKDVGVMGWVTLDPASDYMQLVAPILQAKAELDTDAWMGWLPDTRAKQLACELAGIIDDTLGDPDVNRELNLHYLKRAIFSGYAATVMEPIYAKRFKGMSESRIDDVLSAFAFKNCRPQPDLLAVIRKYMEWPA